MATATASENRIVPEQKNKPVPNEQTLAKLLEAAYVLQEHNRQMRELELEFATKRKTVEAQELESLQQDASPFSNPPEPIPLSEYAPTLAKFVDIQHKLQVDNLELESALSLIAEHVLELTKASGAAAALISGKTVRYRAVCGLSTLSSGSTVPVDKSLLSSCVNTGQSFRCSDMSAQLPLDLDQYKGRGIQSMLAVPVFHDGGIAGGLEVYYASPNAFTEQDVHTCQLMAGLVTEALIREENTGWQKSVADERAAMLQAIEKLQPNLEALVEKPGTHSDASPEPQATLSHACRKCGHRLVAEEQFCGQCGTPRASDYEPPSLQSKVASLWHMQESQKKTAITVSDKNRAMVERQAEIGEDDEAPAIVDSQSLVATLKQQIPDLFASSDLELPAQKKPPQLELEIKSENEGKGSGGDSASAEELTEAPQVAEDTALTHRADWSSAASARQFLEQLASSKRKGSLLRFWHAHRGDIYLAVAVILVLCVIRWGIWSSHSVKATPAPTATSAGKRKSSPEANLSLFDRTLIQLGLAEAPDPAEDKGNPGVQVWVDERTALYYCPGTDLYGKTPKGKFTTQREAQLDQFEPAYRKACN